MKTIQFTKMVGAGNDFLVVENAGTGRSLSPLAVKMCARQNGIGADGLLLLEPSKKADYKMRIINSDGSEAEMCGNGARCLAAYIVRHRGEKKKQFTIETLAGILLAEAKNEVARVRLSDPKDYRGKICLDVNGRRLNVSYIDSGVPHTVIFVDGLKTIDVDSLGRTIRTHDEFKPRGANVNFVERLSQNFIELRTFERGVEAETFACGTGAVASALIGYLEANPLIETKKGASMKVKTKSGEVLDVSFDLSEGKISNVWLKGSAKFIAQGEYFYV